MLPAITTGRETYPPFEKITDGQMTITLSKKDEEMDTLDGKNRILPEGTIVVRDSEKLFDLDGLMGGLKSEIDNKTTTIVLSCSLK